MEIKTTGGITGPDPIQPQRTPANRIRAYSDSAPAADRAEISDHARFLSHLREVPPIRTEKVEELKALIASGNYETPGRIAGAVEKLLEEMAP